MNKYRIEKPSQRSRPGSRGSSMVSPSRLEQLLAMDGPETRSTFGGDSQPDISTGPTITPFDLIMMNVIGKEPSTGSYPTNIAFILARAGYDSNGIPLKGSVRLPNSLAEFESSTSGIPPTDSGHTPFSASGPDGRAFRFDRGPHGQKPHPFEEYERRSAEQPAYSNDLGAVPAIAIDPPQRYADPEASQIFSVGRLSTSQTLGSSLSVPSVNPSPRSRSGSLSPASSASTPNSVGITSAAQSPHPLSTDLDEFLRGFLQD